MTCGRLRLRVAGVRLGKGRKVSCGSSVEASVKMSELGPVTSFIFHMDIEGGTHDVPCCKHAIDYGTAEGRHDTKTDEDNGRHQLGEEERGEWVSA